MKNQEKIKFIHCWVTGKKTGRATIAYRADGEIVTVTVAFCSPKDEYFRPKGREEALKRFADGQYLRTIIRSTFSPSRMALNVIDRLITGIGFDGVPGVLMADLPLVPTWAANGSVFTNQSAYPDLRQSYRPIHKKGFKKPKRIWTPEEVEAARFKAKSFHGSRAKISIIEDDGFMTPVGSWNSFNIEKP